MFYLIDSIPFHWKKIIWLIQSKMSIQWTLNKSKFSCICISWNLSFFKGLFVFVIELKSDSAFFASSKCAPMIWASLCMLSVFITLTLSFEVCTYQLSIANVCLSFVMKEVGLTCIFNQDGLNLTYFLAVLSYNFCRTQSLIV